LLTIYLPTTSSILSSLPISNIILLKLLFSPFMTITSKLWVIKKSYVSLFLSYLLLLTLDHSSLLNVFHPALAFLLLLSLLDQILFTKTVLSMSILKTLNHLYSNFFMEFLKDLSFLGPLLFIVYTTPLRTVISNLKQTITSMLMILNFSYHSQLWISHNITHLENTITGCLSVSCL